MNKTILALEPFCFEHPDCDDCEHGTGFIELQKELLRAAAYVMWNIRLGEKHTWMLDTEKDKRLLPRYVVGKWKK